MSYTLALPLEQRTFKLTSKEKRCLYLQNGYYALQSLGLALTIGYYLVNIEADTECSAVAPNNVAQQFKSTLTILLCYHLVDVIRSLLVIAYAMGIKADVLARLYEFSAVNGCLGLAAFIILHKYRYSKEGKICSNDNNLEDTEGLLSQRGQLLYAMVVIYWSLCAAQCLCCCSVMVNQANRLGE